MKFLQRIAKFLFYSPFEAANPSIRRSHVPGAGPTDARKELTQMRAIENPAEQMAFFRKHKEAILRGN